MSVGTSELDRSVLERKDREELTTIATALGEKPPSRAKKADIVDLILRLAGVEEAPSGEAAPAEAGAKPAARRGGGRGKARTAGSEAADAEGAVSDEAEVEVDRVEPPEAKPEPAATEQGPAAEAADGAAAVNGVEATGGDGPDEEPPAEWETFVAEDAAAEAAESTKGGGRQQNRNGQGRGDRSQGQGADRNQGGDHGQGGRDRSQGDKGSERSQGDQQGQGDNRQQFRVEGEPEAGNRRRRRRGRDRDREPREQVFEGEPVEVEGLLDLRDDGYGFLRIKGFLPSKDDAYVSVKQVRQFGLRKGDRIKGASRPAARSEKNPALLRIDLVNGADPEQMRRRPRFEDLTPLFPDEKLRLESNDPTNMTARIVDLLAPIGKGQRGLIVSPPKAGKTTIMKTIARSIEQNNPEVHLIVLLVDERPEEVTDFRRWLVKGEVAASTFDRPSDEHTQVAELVIERAKRMVEEGKDVVIILDGITRLARAYNLAAPASGRIMSGGIDAGALYPPKKFFGAARNVEEGGSLTILATALVETNSRMDDHIFEEFKGTGNMELKLDRRLAERRIYPAIDVDASSTRHEELLFERRQLQQVWKLRRVLSGLASEGASAAAGLEMLVDRLKAFPTNDEFLEEIAKAPSVG